jgi:hypothetical protein
MRSWLPCCSGRFSNKKRKQRQQRQQRQHPCSRSQTDKAYKTYIVTFVHMLEDNQEKLLLVLHVCSSFTQWSSLITWHYSRAATRACSLVSCHCSRVTAAAHLQFGILLLQQGNSRRVHSVWYPATASDCRALICSLRNCHCSGAKLSGLRPVALLAGLLHGGRNFRPLSCSLVMADRQSRLH